jgi:hypothetical protein
LPTKGLLRLVVRRPVRGRRVVAWWPVDRRWRCVDRRLLRFFGGQRLSEIRPLLGYSSGFLTVVGASVRLDLKFEVLAWDIELLNRQVLRGLLHVEGPDIQREVLAVDLREPPHVDHGPALLGVAGPDAGSELRHVAYVPGIDEQLGRAGRAGRGPAYLGVKVPVASRSSRSTTPCKVWVTAAA